MAAAVVIAAPPCTLISRPYITGDPRLFYPIRRRVSRVTVYHSTESFEDSGSIGVSSAPTVSCPMLYPPWAIRTWNAVLNRTPVPSSNLVSRMLAVLDSRGPAGSD